MEFGMTQQLTEQEVRTDLYIDGSIHAATGELLIKDPANPLETVGYAAAASREQALSAVAAAKAAYPAWAALDPLERADLLAEGIKHLEASQHEDAAVLSRENGKVLQESLVDLIVFNYRVQLACWPAT
jgi:acyl-CoA reductase-like NAD-dependent aldehyde dehydrogenase